VSQTTRKLPDLVISSRFCGPPSSGNGGYVCGRVAGYLHGPVTVTLRRPVPLAAPMAVEQDDDGSLRVRHDHTLIAEAARSAGHLPPQLPGLVSIAEAHAAAGRARYFADPVYPTCFGCGMSRQPGDGLRIFPGAVASRGLWAAPWTPHPSVSDDSGRVRPEMVWAALDCPSGIAAAEAASLDQDTAILLGRMTADLAALPAAGDPCRVIAWLAGRDGRKLTAGSALIGPDGQVLATASTLWLTVPRPVPPPGPAGPAAGGAA
jgi:hypothetical protein